jgi:dsDNA-specific endonuclease/ATPase MutS2
LCRSRRRLAAGSRASSTTLFIEPLVAVELGNAWREAQAAERDEVDRILDELSALVAANAVQLRETLDALARFDFWAAKAQLAAEMDGIRAETADRPEVALLSARHPGLTGRVVPIDIRLGDGYTALVVTGPNTGGKTVTLRTLGLLALMHQAGLHVPAAAGSRLPVLQDVFADIGDEQSIAQSLSTFSGHLRSITRIVEAAGPGTLILLDELGAGTDPTEGSALAQALLDHFIRTGALVAATTHYAELKAYAHTTAGARNAAVEFDLETLSPTYRLTIGLPGGSQAFAIAERLGLDAAIVADARSRLTENERAFEETLARIRETEGETSEALDRARAAELRAAEALREAAEERRRARRERDELVTAARSEAERLVADLRDDVRATRRTRSTPRSPAPRPSWSACRTRRPNRHPRRRSSTTGRSGSGRRAERVAGRAASRHSSAAAGGRRSRPAGCASRSRSRIWSRCSPSTATEASGEPRGGRAATRARTSRVSASSGRGASRPRWTSAELASMRRSTRWRAMSTMRRSPAWSRC